MGDKPTVAVVGASGDRSKCGKKALRAYREDGWGVYPVHPKAPEIEGLTTYPSLRDVPVRLDRVSLYLPPALALRVLPEIAAVEPGEFFVNPGAESEELVEQARNLGLDPILACSIIDIGETPADFR